jgi:uncharacterized YigZ family protein
MEKMQFVTIAENVEYEIEKIKGSRFIGRLYGIKDRFEAERDLEKIRKMYYDATHNCFAYTEGLGAEIYTRSSDDGEPSGTAGRPIMTVLESSGLSNALLVVTRYYGGTNLGTGGLIKAYTDAAKAVISCSKRKTVEIREELKFAHNYDQTSMVMNLIGKYEASVLSVSYSDKTQVKVSVNRGFLQYFIAELFDRSSGTVRAEKC